MIHRLALRNLFQSRTRLLVSTGGVALALLLILALGGVIAGFEKGVVAYVDNAGADVWVSQSGVRNMHMTSSSLPAGDVARVAAVAGVASATPILYMTDIVHGAGAEQWAYVIGLPPGAAAGGPPVADGVRIPAPGEAVLDRSAADTLKVALGGRLSVLGRSFRVAGLSQRTANPVFGVLFISAADFAGLRRTAGTVSYILVRAARGSDAGALAARIQSGVPGVTAQTRAQFAASEKATVANMTSGVIEIMDTAAFLVGLAVIAVTVYTATLSRRAEYGTLKAVGAGNRRLYAIVVLQALGSAVLALVAAVLLTVVLSAVVPAVQPLLSITLEPSAVLETSVVAVAIAALAAAIPVRQVGGLDPAAVFRRKLA